MSSYIPDSQFIYTSPHDAALANPVNAPATLAPQNLPTSGYTVEDLVKDEYFVPIKEYMVNRFGTHLEKEDREALIEKYLNNMRGFSGGNSVRAVNEIAYLSSLEDDQVSVPGKAYSIFENLPGIFSEESSWSNTLEGTKDYARSAILDPVNVIGGIIGKGVSAGGFRTSAVAANLAARKAYQATLNKQLASRATQEVAQSAALKAAEKSIAGAASKTLADMETRAVVRKQVIGGVQNELLKKIATRGNIIEAATVGTIDGVAAGATDWAYQTALQMTGVTDDRSLTQSGVTALATIAAAGALVSLGGLVKRQGGTVGPSLDDLNTTTKGAKLSGIVSGMSSAQKRVNMDVDPSNWLADAAKGSELKDLDTQFWSTLILGDEGNGIDGMVKKLTDQNYAWIPRDENDTISNYLGDIIKEADPEDFQKFINEFEDFSPNIMSELRGKTQEEIGNDFKLKIRQSLSVGNVMSQASKALGVERMSLTKGDVWKHLQEDGGGKLTDLVEGATNNFVSRTIPRTQNQLIRLLVANLATTQLNLLGWSVASGMDTATDLVTATLQGGKGLLTGNKATVKNSLIAARGAFTKLQNIVDPNTTYEEFLKYSVARPKALRELTNVLPGGVESSKKLYQELDLEAPLASMKFDKVVDFIQDTQLVRAQDGVSKSIEFMTALDTGIRKEFGMSYKEFMGQPDYWAKMSTEKFQKIEQRAATTALDNIFSRSYGKMGGNLGEVADIIEKTRNIPVVGVLLPFGRFFNNTVAFMSDYGGMSLAMRTVGLNRNSTESTEKLLARTAVGWATIFSLVPREQDFIEKGLTWDEQTQLGDVTGEITSEKYNFPYSFLKGMARVVAHKSRGEEVPQSVVEDMLSTFGLESFTRSVTDAFGSSADSFIQIVTGEEPVTDVAISLAKKVGAQVAGSSTRFLEPLNAAYGMAQGRDRVVQDRRQGRENLNQATRYIDNLIGTFEEQRYSPTRGRALPQDSKFIAPVRASKPTNLSRAAALAGIKEWDKKITEIGAKAAASSNRYAQIYNKVNETSAGLLINDPYFQEADQETKLYLVNDLLKMNKTLVKDLMAADYTAGDADLLRIMDLNNRWGEGAISRAKSELGFTMDLEEMTTEQLMILESSLSLREELKTQRN